MASQEDSGHKNLRQKPKLHLNDESMGKPVKEGDPH